MKNLLLILTLFLACDYPQTTVKIKHGKTIDTLIVNQDTLFAINKNQISQYDSVFYSLLKGNLELVYATKETDSTCKFINRKLTETIVAYRLSDDRINQRIDGLRDTTLTLLIKTGKLDSVKHTINLFFIWDKNQESDLAGYIFYYGNKSRQYIDSIDVGLVTNIGKNFCSDSSWFFSIAAYDTANNLSDFSDEVLWLK